MSNRLKRLAGQTFAIVCCTLLLAGSSCTRQGVVPNATQPTVPSADTSKFVSDEQVTFSVWAPFDPAVKSMALNSIGDYEIWQEIENILNVRLEFDHAQEADQEQEHFNLMIAAGDYPSLIMGIANHYTTGPDAAIADGVIIRLNELIENFAPNYQKRMTISEDVRKLTITDQGNIFTFAQISDEPRMPWYGPAVRQDLLTESGFAIPETYDDWTAMLTKFKAMGIEEPYLLNESGFSNFSVFSAGFGFVYDELQQFYQVSGEVRYGPLEPGFRSYIEMLHDWYIAGLISKDFMSNGNSEYARQKIIDGRIAAACLPSVMLTDYADASPVEGLVWIAVTEPKMRRDDQLQIRQYNQQAATWSSFSITTRCQYPEVAARFLDYFYSDDAYLLVNYGIEGKTYRLVDGRPVFTDYMIRAEDKYRFIDMLSRYTLRSGSAFLSISSEQAGLSEDQLEAEQTWNQAGRDYLMPPVTLTPSEGVEFGRIMQRSTFYVNDMVIRFIIGLEPLDSYDMFIERLRNMDIEKAMGIQQDALDRFLSR